MHSGMVFATLTDGRPGRLSQNIYSWIRNASLFDFEEIIIFDNSGSIDSWNQEVHHIINIDLPRIGVHLDNLKIIKIDNDRLPIGKAHDFVFKYLNQSGYKYGLFLEDDVFLTDFLPVDDFVTLLDNRPDMVQIAINRNPVYEREFELGGVMQDFRDMHGQLQENQISGIKYTERPFQFIFTGSFINLKYLDAIMPDHSDVWEWDFAQRILERYPEARFCWYGWISDYPLSCTWDHDKYFTREFHENRKQFKINKYIQESLLSGLN